MNDYARPAQDVQDPFRGFFGPFWAIHVHISTFSVFSQCCKFGVPFFRLHNYARLSVLVCWLKKVDLEFSLCPTLGILMLKCQSTGTSSTFFYQHVIASFPGSPMTLQKMRKLGNWFQNLGSRKVSQKWSLLILEKWPLALLTGVKEGNLHLTPVPGFTGRANGAPQPGGFTSSNMHNIGIKILLSEIYTRDKMAALELGSLIRFFWPLGQQCLKVFWSDQDHQNYKYVNNQTWDLELEA